MSEHNLVDTQSTALDADDRRLAAWESITMQNIGPLLTDGAGVSVWEVVLANRASPNPGTFFSTASKALDTAGVPQESSARLQIVLATSSLRDLLAAGAPAKE